MGEKFGEGSPDVACNKHDPEAGPTDPKGDADAGGFGCMAITRTALRVAEFVLSLISFSLLAASNGEVVPSMTSVVTDVSDAITKALASSASDASNPSTYDLVSSELNDVYRNATMPALNASTLSASGPAFLMAMGVMAFVYALVATILLIVAILRPASGLTFKLPRPLLITDFVILLLLFSASCSAGSYGTVCSLTLGGSSSCGLIQGAAAMGFFASFCFIADFWLTLIPVFVEI